MKACSHCGETKGPDCFYPRYRQCKTCTIAKQRMRAIAHPPSKEQKRRWEMKRLYGLTPADYEALLQKQGGVCAICQEPPTPNTKLVVDHDHQTGRVRALLCLHCNTALGNFRDDSIRVRRAADFLEYHKGLTA